MILTLALRNFSHDRLRSLVTIGRHHLCRRAAGGSTRPVCRRQPHDHRRRRQCRRRPVGDALRHAKLRRRRPPARPRRAPPGAGRERRSHRNTPCGRLRRLASSRQRYVECGHRRRRHRDERIAPVDHRGRECPRSEEARRGRRRHHLLQRSWHRRPWRSWTRRRRTRPRQARDRRHPLIHPIPLMFSRPRDAPATCSALAHRLPHFYWYARRRTST